MADLTYSHNPDASGVPRKLIDMGDGTYAERVVTVDASGDPTSPSAPAAALATTQNALSTAAEVVVAANATRIFAEVKNLDSSINVFLGDDNTVSAANGHRLAPGEAFVFENYTGAIWAIAASGTPTVSTVEW